MTKYLLVFTLFLVGCGGSTINFSDGTWSTCTFSKRDGTSYTAPLQIGGAPMGFTQKDGTKVECIPIPKQNSEEMK